jgi:hypothetical protein
MLRECRGHVWEYTWKIFYHCYEDKWAWCDTSFKKKLLAGTNEHYCMNIDRLKTLSRYVETEVRAWLRSIYIFSSVV